MSVLVMDKLNSINCVVSIVTLLMAGCGTSGDAPAGDVEIIDSHIAMMTDIKIIAVADDESTARNAIESAIPAIDEVESIAAVERPYSELSKLNNAPTGVPYETSSELFEIIELSLKIADESDGHFNPAIGPLIKLYGLKSLNPRIPSDAEINETLPLIDYTNIAIDSKDNTVTFSNGGMAFDLSGIAKGWAVDRGVGALREIGCSSGLIEAGGEVAFFGGETRENRWRLAIASPSGDGVWGVLSLDEGAIATSGDYVQAFDDDGVSFSHILDATTGYPAEGPVSVTIIAADCAAADAYATALMTLPADEGLRIIEGRDDLQCYIIERHRDGFTVTVSSGFPDVLRLEK